MRLTKYGCGWIGVLLVIGGCTAQGAADDEMLGSGGSGLGNAPGQTATQPSAGATAPQSGGGGATKSTDQPKGSGGAQAQAGKGGTGSGGGGTGAAGMGAAGMGAAGMGAAGMTTAGSSGGTAVDSGVPQEEEVVPPDPALCADAVCFDVFDCYLWHIDSIDCGFTDCVDFICQ